VIAAQLHGREDLRVEEVAEPEPGPGEVKIAVAHNGLCGTDLTEYFDGPMACTSEPHPLTGGALPQIMGHEFAGTVTAVGTGVDDVVAGDRVAVEPLYYCRRCHACRAGLTQLCELVMTHGICSNGGGLAEYTVVPSWMLHRLPETMTLAQGALVEPMSVSFSGVLRSGIEPGQAALVLGAGPIGIGVTLGLRAIGIEDITVVEPAPTRRAAVEALGVDVLDPDAVDVVAEVRRRTDGRGVDAAFDCAGAAATFSIAPAVLRPRGRYVILAFGFIGVRSRRGSSPAPRSSSRVRAATTPKCSRASST
jgi:(R,R)-butanediol dehydrogenase/meso-butanediol dehydrogenase/diacetyl reductase